VKFAHEVKKKKEREKPEMAPTAATYPPTISMFARPDQHAVFDDVSLDGGTDNPGMVDVGAVEPTGNKAIAEQHGLTVTDGGGGGRKRPSTGGDNTEETCGFFGLRPGLLQKFRTPGWMVLCCCLASFIQGEKRTRGRV
jgi:hypothetical protein